MSATTPDSSSLSDRTGYDEIKVALVELEHRFDQLAERRAEPAFISALGDALRSLHARIRVRHAAGFVEGPEIEEMIAPHLLHERRHLIAEHSTIIGLIDRLVRMVDSIADRAAEDLDVFLLRGRELIAVLLRHEAEEDRLFYLAYWHDTGGEAGA